MKKLQTFLNGLSELYDIPALDCVVMKNHKIIFRYMTGYVDCQNRIPISGDNLWYFYSTTKIITMIAVLQLIEKGDLHFYDPLWKYIPEYEIMLVRDKSCIEANSGIDDVHMAHHPIRIIDLMTMTSGIGFDDNSKTLKDLKMRCPHASTSEVVREMAKLPLNFEPGSSWEYGFSHDILGAVVERVADVSFEEYLKKEIFDPLEVNGIYFKLDQNKSPLLVTLYRHDEKQNSRILEKEGNAYIFTDEYQSGGAGLIGSVNSYSLILDALACGGQAYNGSRLLSEKICRLLSANYLNERQMQEFRKICRNGYGYGLGVRVLTDPKWSAGNLGEFG